MSPTSSRTNKADVPGCSIASTSRTEVVADLERVREGGARSAEHRTDGGSDRRCRDHEAREKTHRRHAEDVAGGRKRLAIDRKRAVGMPHDDRHVEQRERGRGSQPRWTIVVLHLRGPLHVGIADRPEVARGFHDDG